MAVLLGFAPLMVFYVFVQISVSLALWLAFATAFTLGIRDFVETGTPRLLDIAFATCFGLLAVYDGFIEPGMTIPWVGLTLKLGVLSVALWSLAQREPFTLPYLRTEVVAAQRDTPVFLRLNYILAGVWTGALAVMAGADAVTIFLHTISAFWLAATGLVAFAGALTFTWQFGANISRRLGQAPR